MEKRYVMLWNGGLYHSFEGRNVFTLDQIRSEFAQMLGEEPSTFSHAADLDDDLTTSDLEGLIAAMIEAGNYGESYYILGEALAERGDDYVQASLVSLEQ